MIRWMARVLAFGIAAAVILPTGYGAVHGAPVTERVETVRVWEVPEPSPEPAESFLTVTPSGNVYSDEVPMSYGYQAAMQDACRKWDVNYTIALGIAEVESQFDFEADSGLAWGLMQINPINYDWLLSEGIDATTYSGNIEAGVYMFRQLLDKYHDTHKALMAYNCGEYGASLLWDEGYEQSAYSRAVMEAASRWGWIVSKAG